MNRSDDDWLVEFEGTLLTAICVLGLAFATEISTSYPADLSGDIGVAIGEPAVRIAAS